MTITETTSRTVDVGRGATLDVTDTGSGAPLVLVCGTAQDYRLWAPLLPTLAENFRVIAYNHRGIGDSSRGTGAITVDVLAGDLDTLLTGLEIEHAHILGWSLGSAVAQRFALNSPERVDSLVLAATWGRTDLFQTAIFTALAHPWRHGDRESGLTALAIAYSRELLKSDAFLPMMTEFGPLFPSTPGQIAAAVEQWDADITHDTSEALPGIAAPTLVIGGEQDLLTPPDQGRAVANAIPNARFELLTGPGSSHALLFERAEEFLRLVSAFLSSVPDNTRV